jgi:hypothetical protein
MFYTHSYHKTELEARKALEHFLWTFEISEGQRTRIILDRGLFALQVLRFY